MSSSESVKAIQWRDDHLLLLDQRLLPAQEIYLKFSQVDSIAQAIRDMVVRGAPAIGIVAAYGVALAAKKHWGQNASAWKTSIEADLKLLEESRPTAVNLFWALARMRRLIADIDAYPFQVLLHEAQTIHEEDYTANLKMGALGASLIAQDSRVLTHCNTGSLATGGHGTALGIIRTAFAAGKLRHIYASETRPWLQGSRLTAWELMREGIPVTLICEGAAASLLNVQKIDWVIVGADRIAANGDVVNKIGTYSLAVLARHHGARFMVAAPMSTIDRKVARGEDIKIECRPAEELLYIQGHAVGTQKAEVWNPVFDLTPAEWIDVLITEKAVVQKPDYSKIAVLFANE